MAYRNITVFSVQQLKRCNTTMAVGFSFINLIAPRSLFSYLFRILFVLLYLFVETRFLCSFGACPGNGFCKPGWTQTQRNPPASASWMPRLKACTNTAQLRILSQTPLLFFQIPFLNLQYSRKVEL